MTPQDIKDVLDEVAPYLKPSIEVDKTNEVVKRFIKIYKQVTGKTTGAGQCKNCVVDAYFELKMKTDKELEFMTMERKYKLKESSVVGFNNSHYTNANITDEVALAMIEQNRNHAKSFVNSEALLADFDAAKVDSEIGSVSESGDNIYVNPQPKKRGRKRKG